MAKRRKTGKYSYTEAEQEALDVMRHNSDKIAKTEEKLDACNISSECATAKSIRILENYGTYIESSKVPKLKLYRQPPSETLEFNEEEWQTLVQSARAEIGEDASIEDILLPEEIQLAEKKLALIRGQFDEIHNLDKVDWLLSAAAGSLAAIVDVFLVQMPKHPGFLGGKSSTGGPLSNFIRERVQASMTPSEISQLERANWVPYDPAHSSGLKHAVSGLSSRTHRFQSLGHDPVLGFLFGVKDILSGTFTAIDTNGEMITQAVNVPLQHQGMGMFAAILRQFGHLQSDVATPAGLPAPLMPLLQLVRAGSFGKRDYPLGELTRIMYRQGYDFSHFLSMSIPVLMIEGLVRGGYFFKRLSEGYEAKDSIPFNVPGLPLRPKLQTMLFTAHTIATSVNLAKVSITQNPLAVNYPQWIMFVKSLFSQLNWVMIRKPKLFDQHFDKALFEDWENVNNELNSLWCATLNS